MPRRHRSEENSSDDGSSSDGSSMFSSMFSSSSSSGESQKRKKRREEKRQRSSQRRKAKVRREEKKSLRASDTAALVAERDGVAQGPALQPSVSTPQGDKSEDYSGDAKKAEGIHGIDADVESEVRRRIKDSQRDDFLESPRSGPPSEDSSSDEAMDAAALSDFFARAQQRAATVHQQRSAASAPSKAVDFFTDASQHSTTMSAVQSNALVAVDVSHNEDDYISKIVASKAPPPPTAEDAKKIVKLQYVDHSKISYRPFDKDFYMPSSDIKALSDEEIAALLQELDGAKVKGREVPRPIRTWDGCGLPDVVLESLHHQKYSVPFAVQCIGVPVLMSGRDLLVCAKTGSGKTLMYALPLVRHVMNQRRAHHARGEGPVALVLVPTQELATQVFAVIKPLATAAKLKVVQCHGCVPLVDNIKECKAGCDIAIAVPGRLLDLLTISNGKVLSLSGVTFVVVDEVDRMFDSGFTDHTLAFLKNIRPDRQLTFVSATLPQQLRHTVLQQLDHPIELTIGGKPTPATNVRQEFYFFDEQVFEVDEDLRKPDERLPKLLQLIAEVRASPTALMMIFVQTKDECNHLFADLTRCGYRGKVALLYAGMEKLDRQFAMERFSPADQFILLSTGLGERGLDIAHLELVVNYSMPDHFEAYIHRIGRTGRAGRPGRAVSFFTRLKDDELAAQLIEGLERAQQPVPEELEERAAIMRKRRQEGLANARPSGFVKGFASAKKTEFCRDRNAQLHAAAKEAGLEGFVSSSESETAVSEDDDDDVSGTRRGDPDIVDSGSVVVGSAASSATALSLFDKNQKDASDAMVQRLAEARRFAESATDVSENGTDSKRRFQAEYPINDEPVFVRQKLQNVQNLRTIEASTNTTIVKKGYYFDPKLKSSYKMKDGDRPLYLLIHGFTIESVRAVFRELDALKKEAKAKEARKFSSFGATI